METTDKNIVVDCLKAKAPPKTRKRSAYAQSAEEIPQAILDEIERELKEDELEACAWNSNFEGILRTTDPEYTGWSREYFAERVRRARSSLKDPPFSKEEVDAYIRWKAKVALTNLILSKDVQQWVSKLPKKRGNGRSRKKRQSRQIAAVENLP